MHRRLLILLAALTGAAAATAEPAPFSGTVPTTDTLGVEAQEARSSLLESRGFYRRRARGLGAFLTRAQFGAQQDASLADVLRGVAGLTFSSDSPTATVYTRGRVQGRACPMAVFLDGAHAPQFTGLDHVPAREVEGVEVYRGPSEVPIEYESTIFGTACGALLIWTRIE